MPELKPYILERKIVPKVWGGRSLESTLGIALPAGEKIGETWELYDRRDGASRIRGSDVTLRDLMVSSRDSLLGRRVRATADGYFPLLIKYIDAADALSVQVHPDQSQAMEEGDNGKHEAWVVLGAGDNARVIRGLRPGVTAGQFAAAARSGEVAQLLWAFRPDVGDAIAVPAGTVHALGPDVVVFEIQQNSDITYRIHDWGRPREIHVEQALRAIAEEAGSAGDRPTVEPEPIGEGARWLLREQSFAVRRFEIDRVTTLGTEGSFKVLNVISGKGTVGWRSGGQDPPLMVGSGDTVLVPACVEVLYLSPVGRMSALWSQGEEG